AQLGQALALLAGIGRGGRRAGQVGVQVRGQRAGLDSLAQARDQVRSRVLVGQVDARQDFQLHGLTVGTVAEVLDLLHVGGLRQVGGQPPDGGEVRGGDRSAVAGDDDQDRRLLRSLERGSQPGGGQAGAAGRQRIGVVLLDDAGQRRQQQGGQYG